MIPPAVTRSDYIYGNITFAEYYGGIAEACYLLPFLPKKLIEQCRKARDQEHFNDVGLKTWDEIGQQLGRSGRYQMALRVRKDMDTMATRVCVLKEAMRRLLRA